MRLRFLSNVARSLMLLALPAALPAQGSLNPPGAPAASMKSLAQVEPRTALAGGTATIVIAQSGSYYLTGNVAVTTGNGITINASNVTLDLNGFSVTSASATASGTGVEIALARSNVTITNGHVQGTATYNGSSYAGGGFFDGIGVTGGFSSGLRVSAVNVNAVRNNGIDLGTDGTAVTSSTVRLAGGLGIRASSVADSSAQVTGGTSISALSASNVAGTTTGSGPAIVPTPTTLAEIDPRIGIPGGTAGYTISQPGSYVLKGNLTVAGGNGITVAANDVSLDLNGFTIASTASPAAGRGIDLSGSRTNISVTNGHIRGGVTFNGTTFTTGPGFVGGIDWVSGTPTNARASNLTVTGMSEYGIDLGSNETSSAQACVVRIAGNLGIRAGTVADSSATVIGNTPISATTAANCVGRLANGTVSSTVASPTIQSVQTTAEATQTAVTTTQAAVTNLQTSVNALESRTAISSLPYTISSRGSYYLTGNLSFAAGNGITINSSQVTLDLNGFSLSGSGSAQTGILVASNLSGVVVRNGAIRGTVTYNSGTGSFSAGAPSSGISAGGALEVRVSQLHVSGVGGTGINLPTASLVEGCSVTTCTTQGIVGGVVRGCVTDQTGSAGIRGEVVTECFARIVGNDTAIVANVVQASQGSAQGAGSGISSGVVHNSYGVGGGAFGSAGIRGEIVAQSYGTGATGIVAASIVHSAGSGPNSALDALNLVIGSYSAGGSINTPHKYNMP